MEKTKEENEKEVQQEIKRMTDVKKQSLLRSGKKADQLSNENKLSIFLDNVCLKLGAKDRKDIIPILREKLDLVKKTNPSRYEDIIKGRLPAF